MAKQSNELDARQQVMLGFAKEAAEVGRHFFYILIREPLGPIDRSEKYEDPLNAALAGFGEVTGGGSQMGDGNTVEYCGLDVVVDDRAAGLQVIRGSLKSSGAPANTVIEEYLPAFRELRL